MDLKEPETFIRLAYNPDNSGSSLGFCRASCLMPWFTVDCVQVTVLLKAAVVFVLLATDVTGVTEATCEGTTKREEIRT